jgi:exodeoxyribonuclease V gamma subunit
MLGLDDGAFPRVSETPTWDPFASPRMGEHDRRTLDRHLFLETLVCARNAVLLFGTGFEPKRGGEIPLSVVVTELTEVLERGTGGASNAKEASTNAGVLRRHPLQPWSPQAFVAAGESRAPARAHAVDALPFDPVWFACHDALRRAALEGPSRAGLPATRVDAAWPTERHPPTTLTVEAMARALVHPAEELVSRRLGIQVDRRDDEIPDREPLELATLDGWHLKDAVLRAWQSLSRSNADDEPETERIVVARLRTRLRAEGTLPLDAGGDRLLQHALSKAKEVRARVAKVGTPTHEPLVASVLLDGVTLSASIAEVLQSPTPDADGAPSLELVWTTASDEPNEKQQLAAWLALLVATASGHPVDGAHAIGADKVVSLRWDAGPDAALALLADLVALWREARTRPLWLLPGFSRELAAEHRKDPSRSAERLLEELEHKLDPSTPGREPDRWTEALHGDLEVTALTERADEVLSLALRVWGPLLDAVQSKKAKRAPKPGHEDGAAQDETDGDEETPS